jgi:hypothetical protein
VEQTIVIEHIAKPKDCGNPDAVGIYFQGSKLRILDVVEELERDPCVLVIHPSVTQSSEIEKRFHVRVPRSGYSRLLSELP